MNQCILLSHLFIRDNEEAKLDQVDFTIQHYRQHNPNAYIIVTGHGLRPNSLDDCDYAFWPQQIIESEINVGHPYLVNIGLDHAIESGFKYLYKCRTDGVILRDNIIDFCIDRIKDKPILLTQQTNFVPAHAGDLFMYGDTAFLKKCWNIKSWYPTTTGLTSFASNILNVCGYTDWKECLLSCSEFVDIFNIRWIDFRANWHVLQHYKADMLLNKLTFEKYLWGSTEKWHCFDKNGKLIYGNTLTEKEFYENRSLFFRSHTDIS